MSEMRCHQGMRPNQGGRRREQGNREREESLYTTGSRNGSVAREMLRRGTCKRSGATLFSEHTQNPVGRCFLDSFENTRIRSGLRPLESGQSYVFLNTKEESSRWPFLKSRERRVELWSVFLRYTF